GSEGGGGSMPLPALLGLVVAAHADPAAPAPETDAATGRPVQYAKKTEIEFEKVDVKATADVPEMVLVIDPPRGRYGSFIDLRRSFNEEMKASVDDVR